jgi:predicted  nucleic acid-binding Zn-ribbon protein
METKKQHKLTHVSSHHFKPILFIILITMLGCKKITREEEDTDTDKLKLEITTLIKEKNTIEEEKNTKQDLLHRTTQAKNDLEQKVSEANIALTTAAQKKIELENQLQELQQKIIDTTADNKTSNLEKEKALRKLNKQRKKLEEKNKQTDETNKQNHTTITKLQDEIEAYKQHIKKLEKATEETIEKIKEKTISPNLPTLVKKKENQPENPISAIKEGHIKENPNKKSQLETKIKNLEDTIALKQQDIAENKQKANPINQDIEKLDNDKKNNNQQIELLKGKAKTETDPKKREETKQEIKKLKQDNKGIHAVKKLHTIKLAPINKATDRLEHEIEQYQTKIEKIKKNLTPTEDNGAKILCER